MSLSFSPTGCIEIRLSDYNLFLLEDYSGGHINALNDHDICQ